ncbi:Serine/threonine-protein kinase stk11 [Trebouxia sp. C0009 RCD-2024]
MQAQQLHISFAEQRSTELENLANPTLQQHEEPTLAFAQLQVKDALLVNAQQQLQQCGRTIQDLTAQLQTATTNAACKLQAQQEELSQWQQLYKDAEARMVGLVSRQRKAERHAARQLQEHRATLAGLHKQHEESETRAAFRIAQLEQAPKSAGATAQMVTKDSSSCGSPESEVEKQLQQTQEQLVIARRMAKDSFAALDKLDAKGHDDGWQLKEQLGKGCTGSVMATNSLLYPNVVLKRGPGSSIMDEAERLWQLRHPSVVQVYAVLHSKEVTEGGEYVNYMALARLGAYLQSMREDCSKRFQVREVVVGFHSVAAGLAHMHSKGLVDQDLHAGNVLQTLDGSGWVKADLGNAVPLELYGQPNRIHWGMCAENTESPEVAQSLLEQKWYHPRFSSDIWALGVLLLQVVGGHIPGEQFAIQDSPEYLQESDDDPTEQPAHRRHLQYLSDLLSPASHDYADQITDYGLAGLPGSANRQLQEVIRSCLHTRPEDRPAAQQVQAQLYSIITQQHWSTNLNDTAVADC